MGPRAREMAPRPQQRKRLDRRNAAKNIAYNAAASPSSTSTAPSAPSATRATYSLDLSSSSSPSYADMTSFRISADSDIESLCRSLGLSGPDDFAIPLSTWEAHKVRISSPSPRSSSLPLKVPVIENASVENSASTSAAEANNGELVRNLHVSSSSSSSFSPSISNSLRRPNRALVDNGASTVNDDGLVGNSGAFVAKAGGGGGIRGVRPPPVLPLPQMHKPPPVLRRPPSMALPAVDLAGSTWDILRSFAPRDERSSGVGGSLDSDEEEEEGERSELLWLAETPEDFTGTSSLSTTNDDEASSTTTELMFFVSPQGRFKRHIRSWHRGMLLGRGSFGVVYEGISE